MGGREQCGPGRRCGLEAQGPPPADQVRDECRHLAGLSLGAALGDHVHELRQVHGSDGVHEDPGGRVLRVRPVAGPAKRCLVGGQEPAVEDLAFLEVGESPDHAQRRRLVVLQLHPSNLESVLPIAAATTNSRYTEVCNRAPYQLAGSQDLPRPSWTTSETVATPNAHSRSGPCKRRDKTRAKTVVKT